MTLRIAAVTAGTAGTGTISGSTTAITGSGTNFNPELVEGSIIRATASGQDLAVATVSDDTHCTVVTAPVTPLSSAAFTIVAMTEVTALGPSGAYAFADFQRWLESKDLGSGLARGAGKPRAFWRWTEIDATTLAALRVICPSKSSQVYIRTINNRVTGTYATYSAVMLWPDDADKFMWGSAGPIEFEFRGLVAL